MSKQQKIQSEIKHKKVYRYLVSQFSDCKVTYDGVQGIDCFITYENKTIPIEIKTCNRIIKNNIIRIPGHPVLYSKYNLGRFKFCGFQQEQLIAQKGWYVFLVGHTVMFGVRARDIIVKNVSNYRISWLDIIQKSYPNWLNRLKMDVYDVKDAFERIWDNPDDDCWGEYTNDVEVWK